jgi:hypothetical protein
LVLVVGLGSAVGAVTGVALGERVAREDYRAALLPHVAEVDDALAALEPVRYADVYSRDDVLLSGGGAAELKRAASRISSLHVPRTLRANGAALRRAASQLATTVDALTSGARSRKDDPPKVREDAALTAGFEALAAEARTWHQQAKRMFGSQQAAEALDGGNGTTVAAFISAADDTCVSSLEPVFLAEDGDVSEQLVAVAQAFERALPLLTSQVTTGPLRTRTKGLRRELTAAGDLPAAIRLLTRGRAQGARAAVEAAGVRLTSTLPHAMRAAELYRDLGARWCGNLLGLFDQAASQNA